MQSTKRPRTKPKRRFSSSSANSAWTNVFAPLNATTPTTRRSRPSRTSRRSSASPQSSRRMVYGSLPHSIAGVSDDTDEEEERDGQVIHSSPSEASKRPSPSRAFLSRNEHRPTAYASLPPTPLEANTPIGSPPETPVSPLSPMSSAFAALQTSATPPFSLWDYLREELLATDFDSHQELKWDRVSNFLSIPLAIEKVSTC